MLKARPGHRTSRAQDQEAGEVADDPAGEVRKPVYDVPETTAAMAVVTYSALDSANRRVVRLTVIDGPLVQRSRPNLIARPSTHVPAAAP